MSEITTNNGRGARGRYLYLWYALFVLVVFAYLFGLTIPLLGPDEPRYAQVAREMLERGDWITPTLGGFKWFEKPALLYWLEMLAYKAFGVSEFAARLGPAIFGLGTIVSLWVLGRFHAARTHLDFDLSRWTAVIAATTLGILVFSRGASFDIIVTFPITASLVSFYIFDQRTSDSAKPKWLPLVLFYFFIGVALLAKGLIGIVFPFAIVGLYYLLQWRLPSKLFLASLIWGTVISSVVAAIWYVPMYERNGYQFIDEFIIQHHFQRFTSNKYQHPQPFYFFLWVLPAMTLPWLPFFVKAVVRAIADLYRRSRDINDSSKVDTLALFGLAWLLVPLAFFSVSGSKLPGYILPAVPGAVIVTAKYFSTLASASRRWKIAGFAISAATLAACIVLLATVVPNFADGDSVKRLIQVANARGYQGESVLNFHSTSHNAEFYAAGRLVRDNTGKQREYWSPVDLRNDIMALGGGPVIVLVRIENLAQLSSEPSLNVEVLDDNGETVVTHVSVKDRP